MWEALPCGDHKLLFGSCVLLPMILFEHPRPRSRKNPLILKIR